MLLKDQNGTGRTMSCALSWARLGGSVTRLLGLTSGPARELRRCGVRWSSLRVDLCVCVVASSWIVKAGPRDASGSREAKGSSVQL